MLIASLLPGQKVHTPQYCLTRSALLTIGLACVALPRFLCAVSY